MRRWILLGAAAAALCGSLIGLFATVSQRAYALRGYVDPTEDASLPFRVPRLGVNVELTQYTPTELNAQLRAMQATHVTWVRQFFPWDQIEIQPGSFAWEQWDLIVEAVAAYPDLHLVAVLMNSPDWARTPGSSGVTGPPADVAAFARFARAFAARYGTLIDYYQVWDEPNLTAAWGNGDPRPAQYMALLRGAYPAIHAADEGAVVIAAALAPTVETGPANISDLTYLRDLYALGARDYMDAVAAKPYGFDTSPDDRRVQPDVLNFSRVIALREEMVRQGDATKPLWASNWGWNSLPAGWNGGASIWGSVSTEDQIAFTFAAIDRAHREWPWMGGMVLTHWQPAAALDNPIWGFSLVGQGGQPTPLLQALQERPTVSRAENGLFFAANPYANYSGVWTFGPLGANVGWVNDSSLSLDFSGRTIALLLREDNYVAYLYPTIDNQQPDALPFDPAGNAYIILTSDTLQPETNLVIVARNLAPGPHTLHIVADKLVLEDARDRWPLIGFAVSDGNLAAPFNRQIGVAALGVAVSSLALLVVGIRADWSALRGPANRVIDRLDDASQFILSTVTSVALLAGMMLTWGSAAPPALFRHEPVQLGLAMLTAGLIYIEPGPLLTLIAIGFLFVLIYNNLYIGLALVLFWSPFFLFPVELYRFAFPLAELLLLITGGAWTLRLLGGLGRWRQTTVSHLPSLPLGAWLRRPTFLDWTLIAWVAIGLVSLSWAQYRAQAVTEFRVILVEAALFYLIMRTTTLSHRRLAHLVDTLLIAGVVVSIVGLILFVQGEATITAEAGARRLASVYGSPNNLALFLGRCIPFGLAYVFVAPNRLRRILAGLGLLPIFAAVLLSQSAGALVIGVPVGIIAVTLLVYGRRAVPALAGITAVGALALVGALQLPRFARLLDLATGTNFSRIRVWQSSVNAIRDHPITGLGLDQFLYAFRGRYIMPDAWQEPNLSHPHNIVLDFWVRLGIAGLIILVCIQVAFWRAAASAYRYWRHRDAIRFALVVGAMGCMANTLAHGLIDNSVYVNDLALVFAFTLGLAAVLSNTGAIDAMPETVV